MGNPTEETCCHPNLKTDCGWVARRFARRPCSLRTVLRRCRGVSTGESVAASAPTGLWPSAQGCRVRRGYLGWDGKEDNPEGGCARASRWGYPQASRVCMSWQKLRSARPPPPVLLVELFATTTVQAQLQGDLPIGYNPAHATDVSAHPGPDSFAALVTRPEANQILLEGGVEQSATLKERVRSNLLSVQHDGFAHARLARDGGLL